MKLEIASYVASYIAMVTLNYNFISTCMDTCGNTQDILHVKCLYNICHGNKKFQGKSHEVSTR